jgi:uncharacterized membrane protein
MKPSIFLNKLKHVIILLGVDLLLVTILSVILILIIIFLPNSLIRVIIGVPFVLFFSGYTLTCVLFPRKRDLDGVERLALSIGLSLAVVPLIGLALNYTPFGIRLYPILLSLFLFSLSMSILSAYRRRKLPAEERFAPLLSFKMPRLEWGSMSRMDKLLSVGLIASILAAGVTVAYVATTPKVGERFTEFYVLGPEGKAENYPTNLTLGESGTVILGVVNHEYEDVTYRILVRLDNETIATIEGIKLAHGEKWEQNFTFTPQKTGENMKLEFLLYREGSEEPYRSLHIWITVRPREQA